MRMSHFLKIAPSLFQRGISVHLESEPGVGKTMFATGQLPQHIGSALGIEGFQCMLRNVNTLTSPDIAGYTLPSKDGDKLVTVNSRSPMLEGITSEYGLMIFDEASQNDPDMQKAMADVYLAGRFGNGGSLPKGWQAWSTGNRMSDKSGVVKPLAHVTNRRCIIQLDFHIDDWVDQFALPTGINPMFIAAARFMPGMLRQWNNSFEEGKPLSGAEPFCSPRSYSEFAMWVDLYTGGNISEALHEDEAVYTVGCGMIGAAATRETLGFMKVVADLPTKAQIENDPVKAAKSIPQGRLDVVYAASNMAIHHATKETMDTWFTFVENLPKEFQTATLLRFLRKPGIGAAAVTTPKFKKWIVENQKLVVEAHS